MNKGFSRKATPSRDHSVAFTLIELLVVIAIIGLLAALLMPSLVSARRRALRVKCIGNQQQIGVAFHLFVGDNDGETPRNPAPSTNSWSAPFTGNWHDQLEKYLNTTYNKGPIFRCPGGDGRRLNKYWGPGTIGQYDGITYKYNLHISSTGPLWRYPQTAWHNIQAINNPADLVIVADGEWVDNFELSTTPGLIAMDYGYSDPVSLWGLAPWHEGFCTYLHADGHVDSASVFSDWRNQTTYTAHAYKYFSPSGTANMIAPNPLPIP